MTTTIINTPPSNCSKNKKRLLIISIVFVVVLFTSSIIVYELTITNVGDGVWDGSLEGAVFVGSASELEVAVDGAVGGSWVVVALDCDVFLSRNLSIPAGAKIILTSNGRMGGFFRLVGARGERVIVVEDGGVLRLCGVVVTHIQQIGGGGGVLVLEGGELVLVRGKISDNNSKESDRIVSGGVFNKGIFRMLGGEISGNNMYEYREYSDGYAETDYVSGGGVCNSGVFELLGGLITNNFSGGGVGNSGEFSMFGGSITKNTAVVGGGVRNGGTFSMFGGSITKNTAVVGGGVHNGGTFSMFGGSITNNTATQNTPSIGHGVGVHNDDSCAGGGGVFNKGTFIMLCGLIADNSCGLRGGSVYSNGDCFIVFCGVIVNNKASANNYAGWEGGNMYLEQFGFGVWM